jgi:hypothetical protein
MKKTGHLYGCGGLGIDMSRPRNISLARIRSAERYLELSLRGLCRQLNRNRIPQLKGIKLAVDMMGRKWPNKAKRIARSTA